MAAPTAPRAVVERTVARFYAAARARDAAAFLSTLADDPYVFAPIGVCADGLGALRSTFEAWVGGLVDGPSEQLVVTSDDGAAAMWSGTDIHGAPTLGLDVFEIDTAGRVRTLWSYR